MALTNVQKRQLRRVTEQAVIGMDDNTRDAYLDAIGADDAAALIAIDEYKARMLPQLNVDLAVHTARKQETQKQINLLNS